MTPGNPSKECGNLQPSDLEAVMVKLVGKLDTPALKQNSSFPILENTKGHSKTALILLSCPFLRHVYQGRREWYVPFSKYKGNS